MYPIMAISICACGQVEIKPLSNCPEPYLESTLDALETNILHNVTQRASATCSTLPHGCSVAPLKKTENRYRIAVYPVAEQSNGQCGYASDTQAHFTYDEAGQFLYESEGAP